MQITCVNPVALREKVARASAPDEGFVRWRRRLADDIFVFARMEIKERETRLLQKVKTAKTGESVNLSK